MKASEKILELEKFIEARLGDMGFELVDIKFSGVAGRETLELFCDRQGEDRITVDDCRGISQRLKYTLEAEGFFNADYSLIVSSPGLDRVVKRPDDFEKFIGRRVKVFKAASAGGGNITGKLVGYEDGNLILSVDDGDELLVKREECNLVRLVPDLKGFEGNAKKVGKSKNR